MKPRSRPRRCRFQLRIQLRIQAYGNFYYIDRIAKLEAAIAKKPRVIQIEMIGVGEIPADSALLMRSVLLKRSPKTRIITVARSSLHNGSVLVWLLGDSRLIRDDARVYFKRADPSAIDDADLSEFDKGAASKTLDWSDEIDPEEADHATVLDRINEFLPIKELAGRVIGVPLLRQFGLVESEKLDGFLATAFARERLICDAPRAGPNEKRTPSQAKTHISRQIQR